jgi:hypothetical protein
MSKENKGEYLEGKTKEDTDAVKEQMIFGNAPSLEETEKKKKKFKDNKLNE